MRPAWRRCSARTLLLVEYGSGSSVKTRLLLDRLERPVAYVPVDISGEHLMETVWALRVDYPGLAIEPVCADFNAPFALPRLPRAALRRAVYFPGSTIGNLSESGAIALMAGVARARAGRAAPSWWASTSRRTRACSSAPTTTPRA